MYTRDLDGRLLMPDLPDDKQVTIALQHNIQRFRAIFDSVDESMALLKPNGNLIEVNLTAVKSLGIGAEATIDLPFGQPLVGVLHQQSNSSYKNRFFRGEAMPTRG